VSFLLSLQKGLALNSALVLASPTDARLALDELGSGARCGALPAIPLRRGLALDNTLALASRPWAQLVRRGTVASLVKARLAQGIAALELGDGMIAVLTL